MAGETIRAWKRLRIPNLLKLALVVITVSGVCLFLMVHQIETPFIKELKLPKTFYRHADLQRNQGYVQEKSEKGEVSESLENDDDAFFKDLHNLHTNLSQQNAFISQGPSTARYKSNKRRHSSKSKRVSMRMRIKLSRTTQSANISHFDSQRRLPSDSRSISDDLRQQLPDSQSDSQQRSQIVNVLKPHIEEEETLRQRSSDSEMQLKKESEVKSNDDMEPTKAGINEVNSFESNSESLQKHTDKIKYLPAKVYENSTTFNNSAGNFGKLQGEAALSQDRPKSMSTNDVTGLRSKVNSEEIERPSSKVVLDYQSMLKPKITNDLRDSDSLPKASSDKGEVSNYRRNLWRSDQLPTASSDRVKHSREKDSSNVVSNYQAVSVLNITNNLRDSDQLPKATSKKRRSLLIFGDDRSGTTFVTKMFAADPQMFTVYEPLWVTKLWFKQFGIMELEDQDIMVTDVVNGLLSCNFTYSQIARNFLAYTNTSWVGEHVFNKNVFKTSPFSAKTKSGKTFWPNLYKYPKFAENVCLSKFKHSVVKVGQVRVPLESLGVFIPSVFRDNPDADVRVIQIVRDPRGSINSRIRSGWISDFTYTGFPQTVYSLCSKITRNIDFGRKLQSVEWLKDRYMEITYKEIATMPVTTARKMYKFAGFEMPDSLIDWIASSTNPDEEQLSEALENPFSHIRDSSRNYIKWRRESPIKRVRVIEEQCKTLLDLLRLDPVADDMEALCP